MSNNATLSQGGYYYHRRRKRRKRRLYSVPINTYLSRQNDSVRDRLSTWSVRYSIGDNPLRDNRSPFYDLLAEPSYKGTDPVNFIVDELFDSARFVSDWPATFVNFERSQRSKVGRFSACFPWSLARELPQYKGYYATRPRIDPVYLEGYKDAVKMYFDLLRPTVTGELDLNTAFDLVRKNTAWGAPHFINVRGKPELIQDYFDLAKSYDYGNDSIYDLPVQLFHRSQPAGQSYRCKHRVVMCDPAPVRIRGKKFQEPMFKAQLTLPSMCKFIDDEQTLLGRRRLAQSSRRNKITGDLVTYDSTVDVELIKPIFDGMKTIFPGELAATELDKQCDHFCYSPFLNAYGIDYGRKGGIPSGSTHTSSVGSAIHDCVLAHFNFVTEGHYSFDYHIVANDDTTVDTNFSIDDLHKHYSKLNLVSKPDDMESHSDQSTVFCQKYFRPACSTFDEIYTGSIYRTNGQVCHSERPVRWANDAVFHQIRLFAILLNIQFHPMVVPYLRALKRRRVLTITNENISAVLTSVNIDSYLKRITTNSYDRDWLESRLSGVHRLPLYTLIKNLD